MPAPVLNTINLGVMTCTGPGRGEARPGELAGGNAHADRAGWDDNPIHGHRLLVEGSTEYGRKVRVTLFPSDVPRLFWCGTAWVC